MIAYGPAKYTIPKGSNLLEVLRLFSVQPKERFYGMDLIHSDHLTQAQRAHVRLDREMKQEGLLVRKIMRLIVSQADLGQPASLAVENVPDWTHSDPDGALPESTLAYSSALDHLLTRGFLSRNTDNSVGITAKLFRTLEKHFAAELAENQALRPALAELENLQTSDAHARKPPILPAPNPEPKSIAPDTISRGRGGPSI